MSPRTVPEPEPLWRALADPTRRGILDALRDGPRTTGALAEAFPTTRFAVMKHLGVLADAGLVTVERRGRERLNHLNPVPLQLAYERWVRPLAAPAAAALLRLGESTEAERTAKMTTPYGLDVRAQHRVEADPERTWSTLLDLARWWPPCWEDGARLAFEPHVGGRLGTVRGRGLDDPAGGALWAVVAELRPGRELALDGTMGIPGPVSGQWRMRLEPAGEATVVTLEHRVLGPVDDDHRDAFTSRWGGVLEALAGEAAGARR
jgi:DNA-binding transcriptional ArsR family regulator